MKKLKIWKPQLIDEEQSIILQYAISLEADSSEKKSESLWFSFDKKYRDYISYEVCDSVALLLLQYCLKGGYDLESEVPMTDRLYYEIVSQFIPQMLVMNPEAHPFTLRMETISPDWKPDAVATAMSCGIDSLTTFYEYTSQKYPERFRLTHLTFFEQGAHHGGGGLHWEEQDQIYNAQLAHVKSFCDQVGYELIAVRSNLIGFLQKLLWHEYYEHTHTYRNMAFALLMQKLIRVYYYAAAYNLDQFSCSLEGSTAHYDKWLLPTLSTDSTSFYSANDSMKRIEKIEFLSTKPDTYDHVLVCYKQGKNCGTCIKCWRTMLEMEICGKLDLYRGSFDVEAFRKDYEYYLTKMLCLRKMQADMNEIYDYMIEHGVEIPKDCLSKAKRSELYDRLRKNRCFKLLFRIKRKLFGQ